MEGFMWPNGSAKLLIQGLDSHLPIKKESFDSFFIFNSREYIEVGLQYTFPIFLQILILPQIPS
jgi:hypothetical protein